MKTNQDSPPTPSSNPSADADTNPQATCKNYSVRIYLARFDEGSHVVRAKSPAEAMENALKLKTADLDADRFQPIESVLQVASIKQIEEGQIHE